MRNDTNEKPFRPLVYICSPFSGDVEGNMERTRQFCRFALFMDIVLQGKCQELWVLGDVISEGMSVEIETAKRRRQPVRYFNADFEEVDAL